MNNHCKTKRLKIAREKSWSTLTEESKQPIVQMLQFKSDNENHKGGMNNAVKKKVWNYQLNNNIMFQGHLI